VEIGDEVIVKVREVDGKAGICHAWASIRQAAAAREAAAINR